MRFSGRFKASGSGFLGKDRRLCGDGEGLADTERGREVPYDAISVKGLLIDSLPQWIKAPALPKPQTINRSSSWD